MHDKTNHKMRVALAAGALLALGLAGCNREKAQMDTDPAAASTATMPAEPVDTMPPPSTYMPPASTTMMPPAGSTMMPPSDTTMPGTTGEVPPMEDGTMTEPPADPNDTTTQPASDAAGAPPTR